MIEHIEAYLKQHYCRDYYNSYGETVEDDHYFMYREEVNGLIELIVRECMRMCEVTEMSFVTHEQREWQGLTHEEHMEIMTGTMTTSSRMAAVEAKLKEKNT